jgi:hypothetical protein
MTVLTLFSLAVLHDQAALAVSAAPGERSAAARREVAG